MDAPNEFAVHRFRFGDWLPSPIKAIASDPFSDMVAVGREDGDIEITNSSDKWHSIARIPGRSQFDLKSLVWSNVEEEKGRLFGISLRGFIFEIDLGTLQFKNVQESYGGAVWCISAHKTEPKLVIGCEDGTVRVFSYASGELQYVKAHSNGGKRVLCVSYHPCKSHLLFGSIDGILRCIEEDTGNSVYSMTGDLMRGVTTSFWSLIVLSDSTIVTGDNRGHVQFWDGVTGVLMVSFHQHTAEVLALASSPDETQVYASGVDCRVTCMHRLRSGLKSDKDFAQQGSGAADKVPDNNWVYTASHRPHSHDVFALCTGKGSKSDQNPILLSGGQDSKLCVYSVDDFVAVRPVWVLPIPSAGLVSKSRSYKKVAIRHRTYVDLWSIDLNSEEDTSKSITTGKSSKKSKKDVDVGQEDLVEKQSPSAGFKLCLRLQLKTQEHIHTCVISADGNFIAVSGPFGTRLWALRTSTAKNADKNTELYSPEKVDLGPLNDLFCHALEFSSDEQRLVACTDGGKIIILDVTSHEVSVRHTFDHHRVVKEGSGGESSTKLSYAIGGAALSADSRFLAVSDSTSTGTIYAYDLDQMRFYWKLPRCGSSISALSFNPSAHSPILFMSLSEGGLLAYDLDAMRLTQWSKDHKEQTSHLLRSAPSPLCGILHKDSNSKDNNSSLLVHGQGTCIYIDMNLVPPQKGRTVLPMLGFGTGEQSVDNTGFGQDDTTTMTKKDRKGRKRLSENDNLIGPNFSVVCAYRSIIDMGCVNGQLVVIENPWVRVLENLPETLARKRYGT